MQTLWSIYFAGIVAMQCHPRNNHNTIDLEACATIADRMVEITKQRYPKWDGSQQQASEETYSPHSSDQAHNDTQTAPT